MFLFLCSIQSFLRQCGIRVRVFRQAHLERQMLCLQGHRLCLLSSFPGNRNGSPKRGQPCDFCRRTARAGSRIYTPDTCKNPLKIDHFFGCPEKATRCICPDFSPPSYCFCSVPAAGKWDLNPLSVAVRYIPFALIITSKTEKKPTRGSASFIIFAV